MGGYAPHYGIKWEYTPAYRGFDTFYGYYDSVINTRTVYRTLETTPIQLPVKMGHTAHICLLML